jgi:hypothetical protein
VVQEVLAVEGLVQAHKEQAVLVLSIQVVVAVVDLLFRLIKLVEQAVQELLSFLFQLLNTQAQPQARHPLLHQAQTLFLLITHQGVTQHESLR